MIGMKEGIKIHKEKNNRIFRIASDIRERDKGP
jgi:hypothetical protein